MEEGGTLEDIIYIVESATREKESPVMLAVARTHFCWSCDARGQGL